MRTLSPRLMLLVLGLLCAGSVGLALLAQHRFDMQPCPWCILQRILFIALSVLATFGTASMRRSSAPTLSRASCAVSGAAAMAAATTATATRRPCG